MDANKSKAVTNIKFVLFSQITVLVISMIRTLIIPKFIEVEDYAYWQTYLLYISYISIFCLGFNDGIYLKYAKEGKKALEENKISSTILIFVLLLIFESIILLIRKFCIFTK